MVVVAVVVAVVEALVVVVPVVVVVEVLVVVGPQLRPLLERQLQTCPRQPNRTTCPSSFNCTGSSRTLRASRLVPGDECRPRGP